MSSKVNPIKKNEIGGEYDMYGLTVRERSFLVC
jgi:hypothetical protein